MHIIFESVLMLLAKIIKISPCLRKLYTACQSWRVFETQCST